ncbi:MAG: putative metal-binding motif-containing protein [Desulfobacterales bacterium]|nr:putative metal-binding motif-containing protein [Desulfobacterales bacterium]
MVCIDYGDRVVDESQLALYHYESVNGWINITSSTPENNEICGTVSSFSPFAVFELVDADGDGYTKDIDCDDYNASVNPDAHEICNGIDDNCDGQTDEIYVFGGFQQPINVDGSSIFKAGKTIPVKISLSDCSGANISAATVKIAINKVTDLVLGTEDELDIEASGNANTGNIFRYDETDQQFIFNLSTKGLTAGTYSVYAKPDDGSSYSVMYSLE